MEIDCSGNERRDNVNQSTSSASPLKKTCSNVINYSEIAKVTESVQGVSLRNDNIKVNGTQESVTSQHHMNKEGSSCGVVEDTVESADNYKGVLKEKMLDRVANSDAHFKHQQRGEPDLTFEDKLKISIDILDKNPVTFLSRFGHYLLQEDLAYFSDISDQYEINFYLTDIRKLLDDKKNTTKKRNRRFEAMKMLMTEDDYFSVESMKERDPLLYEQLIGQYLTEDEINEQVQDRDLSMSAVMMQHVQAIANSELYNKLCDIEDSQMEEEEDESSDLDLEEEEDQSEPGSSSTKNISPLEKQMLKNEFLRTMQLRFLNGEDNSFNYKEVDENVAYDSLDIREHDEEEKYFDQSDSESVQSHDRISQHTQSSCGGSVGSVQNLELKQTVETDEELDYEQYTVEEDVCPGLNCDKEESNVIEYHEQKNNGTVNVKNMEMDSKTDSDKCDKSSESKSYKWGEYVSDRGNNG